MKKASMEGYHPDAPSDLNDNYTRRDARRIEFTQVDRSGDQRIDVQLYDENGNPIENGKIRVYAPDLLKLVAAIISVFLIVKIFF